MIYVGIDVASKKHDCYMASDKALNTGIFMTIENTVTGFNILIQTIEEFMKQNGDKNVHIGLESTGHYSHNILHYLVSNGYDTMLINPLLTNMERKSSSVRKTKTDKIDAKSICTFLIRNQEFKPYTIQSYHSSALKSLSRSRFSLVKQLSKKKQELHMLISLVFPEYLDVFTNLCGKTSLAVLEKYPTPSTIAKTRIDGLTNVILNASKGRHGHGQATAVTIKELAKNSAGDQNSVYSFQIKLCIETIYFFQKHIKAYNDEIKKLMDEHYANILTVPGISYVTGGFIIGETGNVLNFKSAEKLLAFSGLDPSVYQSGKYNADNIKVSKRGSSYLRWAIHTAASVIIHHDNTFSAYYSKKRKEGKHHLVALGHVSKKLVRVIYSILKYNLIFIPQS